MKKSNSSTLKSDLEKTESGLNHLYCVIKGIDVSTGKQTGDPMKKLYVGAANERTKICVNQEIAKLHKSLGIN